MALTFDQAAAARGIDLAHELRNYRRRERYAQKADRPKTDRPKVWPGDTTIGIYLWHARPDEATRDLATLRQTTDTAEYVRLWTKLNHLKQ